jgi:hypothetical protein
VVILLLVACLAHSVRETRRARLRATALAARNAELLVSFQDAREHGLRTE